VGARPRQPCRGRGDAPVVGGLDLKILGVEPTGGGFFFLGGGRPAATRNDRRKYN